MLDEDWLIQFIFKFPIIFVSLNGENRLPFLSIKADLSVKVNGMTSRVGEMDYHPSQFALFGKMKGNPMGMGS